MLKSGWEETPARLRLRVIYCMQDLYNCKGFRKGKV